MQQDESDCILREIQMRYKNPNYVHPDIGETNALYDKLNEIYDQIEDYDPQYVSLRRGQSLTLSQIQRLLGAQLEKAVLLEYFVTSEKTFIFVVTADSFHVKESKSESFVMSKSELNRLIEKSLNHE